MPRRKRFQNLSFNRMIPNMLTLMALTAGLTAIRFALDGRWEHATLAIVAAGILDALDGRIARLLKGASKFGAELDSLSDFVCFGVSPALVLYLWTMRDAGKLGWVLVMLFAICCGLRLARFNVMLEDPDAPVWKNRFFTGIPAPMGGGLVLLPMVFSFQVGEEFFRQPWIAGVFLLALAAAMVSTVPTYSFKGVKISRKWILPTMLITGGVAVSMLNAPWISLSVIGVAYIATIPFSIRAHRALVKTENGNNS
ncbi:MAG: phosphatidylcholine/phosphatidylserine synthase [Rhodospirillales bacterium]|nr:phosphatidylcholine/phosphatidylserine synthase [Alphaproteobacteria bacterium]MBL6948943.1 phosphatidylcholine/phosphatidylserine synthase [Rhodospirillales bacterium]